MSSSSVFWIILLGTILCSPFVRPETDPVDQAALIAFHQGLTSRGSLSWFTTSSLCGQSGISCVANKVRSLIVTDEGLHGTIATELGLLTSLHTLDLDYNLLSGTIPTELGLLTQISTLYMNSNKLTGTIPTELGKLTSMTIFTVDINQLTGTIPSELHSHPFHQLSLAKNDQLCYWVNYGAWSETSDYEDGECKNCVNPCQNLGKCSNGLLTFSCLCTANSTGPACETCKPGHFGENCLETAPPCPAENTGSTSWPVTTAGLSAEGNCEFQYSVFVGSFPSPDLRPHRDCLFSADNTSALWAADPNACQETCDLHGCENGGTCFQGMCVCDYTRYRGKYCEISGVATCFDLKCLNGGACLSGATSDDPATCNCTGTGYDGVICQTVADDCIGDPCKNGGRCTDLTDAYVCDCTDTNYIGTTCDISLIAMFALPSAIAITLVLYLILRCCHPRANNAVVLSFALSIYDFVTDCAFMFSQSQKNPTFFAASLAFIIIPVVFNLWVVAKIFVTSVLHQLEMEKWLKENFTVASAVAILASTNIEMFSLLHSRLFDSVAFDAPFDPKALRLIMIAGLVGSLLEDVPQLVIQSLAASEHLDTVTFLSIVASILTICFGIFKRGLMFLVSKFGFSSRQPDYFKQTDSDADPDGGQNLRTAYTHFDDTL